MSNDVNFKKLNELEVIEEAGESTYAVVEENGVPKRIPGKKIGGGLPEGGAPYQQLVTDGAGVAKWEDRTHYSEIVVNFEYDGDKSNPIYDATGENVLISDKITSLEQLAGAQYVLSSVWDDGYVEAGEGSIIDISNADHNEEIGLYTLWITDNFSSNRVEGCTLILLTKDFPGIEGEIPPTKAGLYFAYPDNNFLSKLYKENIKTIDPKYLPTGAGGGTIVYYSDLADNDLTTNAYLYKDAECTVKVTYDELMAAAISSTIVIHYQTEYQEAFVYPEVVVNNNEYASIEFTLWDGSYTRHSEEWNASSGPV